MVEVVVEEEEEVVVVEEEVVEEDVLLKVEYREKPRELLLRVDSIFRAPL